jgi:hypothetical protein
LQKLATVSNRNWKKRFFTVNPYAIAYYVDESPNHKPKGEIAISPMATLSEEKVDKKYGYGFKYSINGDDSIVLAAQTEVDRAHWMQTIQALIQASKQYLMDIVSILPESTILQATKSTFGLRAAVSKVCMHIFIHGFLCISLLDYVLVIVAC